MSTITTTSERRAVQEFIVKYACAWKMEPGEIVQVKERNAWGGWAEYKYSGNGGIRKVG